MTQDDQAQTVKPNDIGYVYGGYAPLSVRLVQLAASTGVFSPGSSAGGGGLGGLSSGLRVTGMGRDAGAAKWGGFDDILPGGPSAQVEQKMGSKHQAVAADPAAGGEGGERRKKVTLVYFLGGVTFAEISALRYLSQLDEERQYVIATTKIIHGDSLLQSMQEKIPVPERS